MPVLMIRRRGQSVSYDPVLANNTWEQISTASQAGVASKHWSIGDEKDVTLTTGETLTLQIYDFDHDDLAYGSGKAGITFGMKNLMADTRAMNSSNTNAGGFTGSAMYTWLIGTLEPTLPADLWAVMQTVNKMTSAGSASTTIDTNRMGTFLFSEIECFGVTTYSAAGEGYQYPIFTDNASRIKYLSNGAGDAYIWRTRSPTAPASTTFLVVNASGVAATAASQNLNGVCFGFCV